MYNLSQANGLSAILGFPSFSLTSAATTFSTANAATVAVNGVVSSFAAQTTQASPTVNSSPRDAGAVNGSAAAGQALAITAPAASTQFRGALIVWTIDTGGTRRMRSRGFFESNGDPLALEFPEIPVTEVPFAYFTLKAISTLSGTWTHGSSNWTGVTGMTAGTPVNICMLPAADASGNQRGRVILT